MPSVYEWGCVWTFWDELNFLYFFSFCKIVCFFVGVIIIFCTLRKKQKKQSISLGTWNTAKERTQETSLIFWMFFLDRNTIRWNENGSKLIFCFPDFFPSVYAELRLSDTGFQISTISQSTPKNVNFRAIKFALSNFMIICVCLCVTWCIRVSGLLLCRVLLNKMHDLFSSSPNEPKMTSCLPVVKQKVLFQNKKGGGR